MECIICQDSNDELLQDNTNCGCKYKYHSQCWIDYVHSKKIITCPLCRKELSTKKSRKVKKYLQQSQRLPYSPLASIPEEQYLTYDEFITYISSTESYQGNTNIVTNNINISHITPPAPIQSDITPKTKKILKTVLGITIIIAIVVLLIVIL